MLNKRTYCVSDIHSTYTKFLKSIPKDCGHLIINGDLFNKGREQEEMLFWFMKNYYKSDKYTFIFGNHEVRFFNELYRMLKSDNLQDLYDAWFESDNPFNIANVAKKLIDEGKLDADELFNKALKVFKFYHIYKSKIGFTYIISHASWDITKKPKQQNKKNLVYDTILFFNQVRKKNNPILDKYALKCKQNKIIHVIGHYVCSRVFKVQAPYINRDVFYFIDNGVFKTNNPYYFMNLDGLEGEY